MPDKPTQKLLPFDDPPAESSHFRAGLYDPSEEALAAFERLEAWLIHPRTNRPETELAEQTLRAVARALLEGKNGWFHAAEDYLETLKLRNGKTEGDDISAGIVPAQGDDFHADIETLLDLLHERLSSRDRPR